MRSLTAMTASEPSGKQYCEPGSGVPFSGSMTPGCFRSVVSAAGSR